MARNDKGIVRQALLAAALMSLVISSAPQTAAAQQMCPADFTAYRGTRVQLTCQCTPSSFTGRVWGSGPYTDDSSVCRAALHAGRVSSAGGIVAVRAVPGDSSYAASTSNGVTSESWGSWDGGFVFR